MAKNKIFIQLILLGTLVSGAEAVFSKTDTTNRVQDSLSKLIWEDQITMYQGKWEDAIKYCEDLELDGYSNWRLPNHNELFNLADRNLTNPALSNVFTNSTATTPREYWSSTTYIDTTTTTKAWTVSFDKGLSGLELRTTTQNVRCVREER